MKKWPRRIRGAALMGLAWAAAWAPAGVLIGMIVDPDGAMDEMWIVVGAYPGFLCGVVFSAVRGIAERHRAVDALPLPRSAAWGGMAGLLVGLFPFAVGTPSARFPLWLFGLVIVGSLTFVSAVSAVGSTFVARWAKKRRLRDAGAEAD